MPIEVITAESYCVYSDNECFYPKWPYVKQQGLEFIVGCGRGRDGDESI